MHNEIWRFTKLFIMIVSWVLATCLFLIKGYSEFALALNAIMLRLSFLEEKK